MNLDPYFVSYTSYTNIRLIVYLNVKGKTTQFLNDNTYQMIHILRDVIQQKEKVRRKATES